MPPNRVPGLDIKGSHKHLFPGTGVQEHSTTEDDWTGTIAPHMPKFTQVPRPQFPTVKIVGMQTGRCMPNDDPLSIACRGRTAIAIRLMGWHLLGNPRAACPQSFPCLSIKTKQRTFEPLWIARGANQHFPLRNDRTPIARLRKDHRPADILTSVPLCRIILGSCHPGSAGPSKLRPFFRSKTAL